MNILLSITSAQLKRAADIKDKIAELKKHLSAILGSAPAQASKAVAVPAKRSKMSAAARAKIGAAQRARWAKVKGVNHATKTPVKKFKRSAAVKAKLSALAKARWARVKAAGKNAL
ncbi:MAG TPA: hypothetical protein VNX46_04505 [Candidatus Acidoferrum sp.]|nr:hypothetical protein [Candidatus Acidoferrum sp.]